METVIIIGAGPAGCEAAYQLANQNIRVELVEKNNETGGNLNNWYQLFPDRKYAQTLNDQLKKHLNHPNINLHVGMEPRKTEKSKEGNYSVLLSDGSLIEGKAMLITTGFRLFDARRKEEYGYGIYENVITSVELENMFYNHSIRTRKGKIPQRIGVIHCVGSRDEKVCNYHCSKLCCITGVKQAIELRELLPEAEIFCFYMDMRMFGPGYEEMYREAQEKYNIKFVRGRLSEAAENMEKQIIIKVEDTLVGKPLRMTLDMMVLLIGMESSEGNRYMAQALGLELAPNGFIKSQDPHYRNNLTNKEGIFIAGCSGAPMNLTDTLADARSAATHISEYVKQ
ncbi:MULTISPECIES: FAD-dependent oxidoreductase [Sanguibacteroides]|uniref:Pyridine nucleotide-disulfide oxidoreductase n=1 Tax=Sanguibacteroides justesenii TaxID=1547597 RepID=A0AB34R4Y9_9PORP|nr:MULTISPECIES: NAD(P)/FAD-dependent oxidoreductase [Sanguibacteroides]KIO46979.1 pyridine nucleotide-disulfide oxidoreductase [Sanguibacteroides justesenii]PXZ43593.1 CoB--CoM heterodisulfide reductase iron-sulfur subunit A family protein [Sanguibacteroides justesenii]